MQAVSLAVFFSVSVTVLGNRAIGCPNVFQMQPKMEISLYFCTSFRSFSAVAYDDIVTSE
jgi:hypothetical protein